MTNATATPVRLDALFKAIEDDVLTAGLNLCTSLDDALAVLLAYEPIAQLEAALTTGCPHELGHRRAVLVARLRKLTSCLVDRSARCHPYDVALAVYLLMVRNHDIQDFGYCLRLVRSVRMATPWTTLVATVCQGTPTNQPAAPASMGRGRHPQTEHPP